MTGSIAMATAPGRAVPLYRRIRPWHLVAAVALIGALIPLGRLLQGPSLIESLSVENPTVYDVRIEVTDDDQSGRTTVGTARRGDTTTFHSVIDQGSVWIFLFHSQGEEAGELRVERAQLEADDWTLTIPETVEDELRRKGAPPPP